MRARFNFGAAKRAKEAGDVEAKRKADEDLKLKQLAAQGDEYAHNSKLAGIGPIIKKLLKSNDRQLH